MKTGAPGPHSQKDRVEALGEEIVDRLQPSDGRVGHDLHADFLQVLHLGIDDALGEAELGDPVDQHAARFVQGLEDGHIVAHLDEIAGDREPRGAGPDDGDALSRRGRQSRDLDRARVSLVIGDEALQAPDGDGVPLLAEDAELFALVLLGADPAADGGQAVRLLDLPGGLDEVPVGDQLDKGGDVDVHGASRHAAGLLALDAAPGFQHGRLRRVPRRDLVEIGDPCLGVLLRHALPGDPLLLFFLFGLFLFSHSSRTCRVLWLAVPARYTSGAGSSGARNPPRGRRTRGRPRR